MASRPGSRVVRLGSAKTIGSEAAEQDPLLTSCFIRTSAYETIANRDDPKCVIVARAGMGKTAIVRHLRETHDHVLRINPQSLAFHILSRSEMLRSLREAGIHLDAFYESLWRHVFVIELLKHYSNGDLGNKNRIQDLFQRLMRKDRKRATQLKAAAEYLEGLSVNFFNEISDRIVEIHSNLESNMRGQLKLGSEAWATIFPMEASVSMDRVKRDAVSERLTIAQQVVSTSRIAQLDSIVDFMDEVIIDDFQKSCFVIVDDLDTNWVDESIVYDLTRSLLLEVFHLASRVDRVKVVICIRDNILLKAESAPPVRGYQRDKLESQRVHLRWSDRELRDMVEARVNHVLKTTYTDGHVFAGDIFQARTRLGGDAFDVLLDRTSRRPRDVVHYVNLCLRESEGRLPITKAVVERVEAVFSDWRFRAIVEEWRENYPGVEAVAMRLLRDRPAAFRIADWGEDELIAAVGDVEQNDWGREVDRALMGGGDAGMDAARRALANVMYEVGMVGLRLGPAGQPRYANEGAGPVAAWDMGEEVEVVIPVGLRSHFRTKLRRSG